MLWDIFYGRHLRGLCQPDSQDSNFVQTLNDRSCSESRHHPTCNPTWLLYQCAVVLSRWHRFDVHLTVGPNRTDHLLMDQHNHQPLPIKHQKQIHNKELVIQVGLWSLIIASSKSCTRDRKRFEGCPNSDAINIKDVSLVFYLITTVIITGFNVTKIESLYGNLIVL